MNKTIYLLNIGDYAPTVTELTYPTIYEWATKIDAAVHIITSRMYPEWPITYEKLQIHYLADRRGDDWAIYLDSDTLVHPELPDVTELIPRNFVAHNAVDFAPVRWRYDKYFRRHGKNIGSANWFACASSWCLDLWRPLDDLSPEEAIANITLSVPERKWMKPEHLVDDYALSRNVARFGLNVVTLNDIWKTANLGGPLGTGPEFFFHEYLLPIEDYPGKDDQGNDVILPGKVSRMKSKLEGWYS